MRFAPRKTVAMTAVLIVGLLVAWIGFSGRTLPLGLSIPFGISIVLCFLVWIIGARIVHVAFRET
ncbi:hypothetical protein [Marivita sp.]|uniref:hypothetical protein n=1 Tax=Marivita sp. TaxID=2003365 RepID=UPI0025C28436|nr:hypothetical protein [Marivita sp.]